MKCELSDIIIFKNGKKRPSTKGNIPVYGGNGILGYTDSHNYKKCIVIGRVGAYCGSVYYEDNSCWISDNAIAAIPKEGTNALFLYYLLKSLKLNQRHIGTSQPLLTQDILNKIQCDIPDLEIQERIAALLSSFDKKIEVNQKISDNIEQQILAIYKSRFYNVLQETSSTIEQLVSFSNGKKRPAEVGNIPVYGGNGILAHTNKASSKNCIIIGRVGAYCGNVFYSREECWVSDNAIEASSKISKSQLFTYCLLKSADLPSRHIGTGQPLMTQGILNSIPCSIPPSSDVDDFNAICEPMQQQIENNNNENCTLTAIRDMLLFKLMSGEIDISNIRA